MKFRKLENQQIYKSGGFTVKRHKMQQILIPFLTQRNEDVEWVQN